MNDIDEKAVEECIEGLNPSLAKRAKRRVTARIHAFFAATAPGLEHLCLAELLELPLSEKKASVVPGGVEFTGKLHDCYLANLHLRTANRVLMRVCHFRATGFAALEKRLAAVDWELFLPPKGPFRVSVASSKSRLYHRGAVAQRFQESIARRMGPGFDAATLSGAHVFVRAESDRFTVSIDSSGELLHKRGIKPAGGKAPIRETLAAAVLKIAGYRPGELLVDPMCGSGTFSLEAAMMSRNLPAGWFREFAFMQWPAFSPGRWRYLRQEAETRFASSDSPCVFASDLRDRSVQLLREHLSAGGLSDTVTVACMDFFDLTPERIAACMEPGGGVETGLGQLVLNPPYGLRLGTVSESRRRFVEILAKLEKDFKGWRAAIIVPRSMVTRSMEVSFSQFSLFHGGLDLVLLTGRV